MASLSITTY